MNLEELKKGFKEFVLGILMFCLFIPEFILYFIVGRETILKSYGAVLLFFIFTILFYTLIPMLIEKKYGIVDNNKSTFSKKIIAVCISIIFIILKMFFYNQYEPKFITEFINFHQSSGFVGVIGAILQHMYYFAEMVLCCYILRLFQKSGELIFKCRNFPYGGIVLGIFWGLIIHIISQGILVGIYMMILSCVWGVIYIVSGRDNKIIYILMTLMFII